MSFDYKEYWQNRWYNPQDLNDDWAVAVLNNVVGDKVLDLGCGSARFRPIFAAYDYTGVDINSNNIKVASIVFKGKFKVVDIVTDKLGKFDTILCWQVLDHIPSGYMVDVAKKINRSCKRLIIATMSKVPNTEYTFKCNYEKLFNIEKEIALSGKLRCLICKGEI